MMNDIIRFFTATASNKIMEIVVICIVMDTIFGVLRAIKEKKFNSNFGINGAIFEPVYNTAGVEQLNKELAKDGGRTVMVSGCIDTQKLHFSSAIASNYNFQLVITSDEGKARDMAEDARFFNGGNVMYYPAKDVIFYNADVQGRQIAGERIRCIAAIIDRLNKSDIVKSGTEKSTEEASDGPLTIDNH